MSDIVLTKNDIENLTPLSEHAQGLYGRCYAYGDGVVKVFNKPPYYRQKKRINALISKNSKIVLYPRSRVLLDKKIGNKLIGYYADMAPGIEMKELLNDIYYDIRDISFDDLLRIYYDGYIPELRKQDVLFRDVQLPNMFIDDNLIYHIDTDFFQLADCSAEVYAHNLEAVNKKLTYLMAQLNKVTEFFDLDKAKEDYVEKMIDRIMKNTNSSINSLGKYLNYRI